MSAETLALALAIASVVAFVAVVIAFRERLRQAAKEHPPEWPSWRLLALPIGLVLVFRLIDLVFGR